jgi:uncharacterized protein YcfJ
MNHALAALTVCIPMLGAYLNDELRIVEVLAASNYMEESRVAPIPNYLVPQQQCRTEGVQVEYEERIPTVQEIQNDDPRQQSTGGAILGGLLGAVLFSQVGGGLGNRVATGAGLIVGIAKGGLGGETPSETKTVVVMKTVKHTHYEQREKCETAKT